MQHLLSKLSLPEKWNFYSHGVALLLTILFSPLLIIKAFSHLSFLQGMGVSVFCLGIAFMYFSSTAYHISISKHIKEKFRRLDHISIFLLISTSYTAFILTYYNEPKGLWFLGIHWLISILGILLKIYKTGKLEYLSLFLYLALGWMVVFLYKDITINMSTLAWRLLVAGGLSYSVGTIFYASKKMKYGHAIWHFFVIGGTVTHFLAIYEGLV